MRYVDLEPMTLPFILFLQEEEVPFEPELILKNLTTL